MAGLLEVAKQEQVMLTAHDVRGKTLLKSPLERTPWLLKNRRPVHWMARRLRTRLA